MRVIYSLLLMLMLPLILLRLFWRGRKQSGYRENIGERFGHYLQSPLDRCIWIHAVSVGETRAAQPLIAKLKSLYPSYPILLTGMTPTGRATALELFGNSVTCAYLPYDLAILHERLLARFRPAVLLIMETEIWPNLLHTCRTNAVPAMLVNARMSEKSRRGYARLSPIKSLARQALQSMHVVCVQSIADAERFADLGALAAQKTVVTGNIKFDVELPPNLVALGEKWRTSLGSRRVLLCASTREDEEALLLAAYLAVFDKQTRQDTLLVLVPRHPQRFDRVAEAVVSAGLRMNRRSQWVPGAAGAVGAVGDVPEVLLGDSMGEMAAYFALSDIVIIGGSFLPLGGQNLIEACALGKPVIMGPSTFNFAEAARLAQEAGAMQQVGDANEAMQTARALLQDSARKKTMSDAGLGLVDENRGATEKTLALIAPVLRAT